MPAQKQLQKRNLQKLVTIKWLYYGALILVTVFLASQSLRSIKLTLEKLEIFEMAKEEVDELRIVNISLLQEQKGVTTDDYIETQARNRLNYTKEGETQFIIPEGVIEDPILAEYVDTLKQYELGSSTGFSDARSFWERWYDFIIGGV